MQTRPRRGSSLSRGHTANERQSQGLNFGFSDCKCMLGHRGGSMRGSPLPVSPSWGTRLQRNPRGETSTAPSPCNAQAWLSLCQESSPWSMAMEWSQEECTCPRGGCSQFRGQGPPSSAGRDHSFPRCARSMGITVSLTPAQAAGANREWTGAGEAHSEGGPPGGGDVSKQPSRMFCPRVSHRCR